MPLRRHVVLRDVVKFVVDNCTASASFPSDTETFYLVFVNPRTIAVTVSKAGVAGTGALLKRQLDWPELNR